MIRILFFYMILYVNAFSLTAVHWNSLPADAIRPEEARHWSNKIYSYPVTACPSGYTQTSGSEVSLGACKRVVVSSLAPPTTLTVVGSIYSFINLSGGDRYERVLNSNSCVGKNMTHSGYTHISTPHYGGDGLCYSNTGLYCKTYAGSTGRINLPNGKQILCHDTSQNCGDSSFEIGYNFSGNTDKCRRFVYSCSVGNLYGLATHQNNNNPSNLFSSISDKDSKATANVTYLVLGNRVVNDNNGAMCVQLGNSTLSQPLLSPTDNINGIQKSGF